MAAQEVNDNLVFFPAPFQGHITPMLQLASLLHSYDFNITIIHARFNSPDPKIHPDFKFISVADGFSGEFAASGSSALDLINTVNSNLPDTFYDAMVELLKSSPVRCVIVDSMLFQVQATARRRLGLPVIVVRTSSVACFNAFLAYPELVKEGFLPVHENPKPEMEISYLAPLRGRDLPDVKGSTPKLINVTAGMVDGAKNSSGIIFNSFEALEGSQISKLIRNLPGVPVFAVGPLHKFSPAISTSLLPQESSCMDWLDKQSKNSVIYVSFGSLNCMNTMQLIEVAWGLSHSNQPFLWVSNVEDVELPADFLSETKQRSKIVSWAPQGEVLKHAGVGAFWTHCGWNSTMESICEGVPMLCSPRDVDQMVNSRFVCHEWKIGVELEKMERSEIERCVKKLLVESEGEEIRERAEKLKRSSVGCIRERGGGSSPSLDCLIEHIKFMP